MLAIPRSEDFKALLIKKFIGRRILSDEGLYPPTIGYKLVNAKMIRDYIKELFGLKRKDVIVTCTDNEICVFMTSHCYRLFYIAAEELHLTRTGLYTNQKWL
jgi:hypothetical protein